MKYDSIARAQAEYFRLKEKVERRRWRLLIPLIGAGIAGWLYAILIMDSFNGLAMFSAILVITFTTKLVIDVFRVEAAMEVWERRIVAVSEEMILGPLHADDGGHDER